MEEQNRCIKVSFETDISSLRHFSTQSIGSRIGLVCLLEKLQRRDLDGDVYVDSWPNMSTVVIVISSTHRKNIYIRIFSTEADVCTGILQSLPDINFTSDCVVLAGNVLLTEDLYNTVVPKLGEQVRRATKAYTYLFTTASQTIQTLPSGYKISPIKHDDYELVSSHWPYTSGPEDANWFRHIGQNFESVAVYSESEAESEIAAWVFEGIEGNFLHLFTLQEHRKQGLGLFVVLEMSKRVQEKGKRPWCFIASGNTASEKLFAKAGFTRTGPLHEWICFNL